VSTLGSALGADTTMAVYTGSTVSTLTLPGAQWQNDDENNGAGVFTSKVGPVNVTAGATYRIAVDGFKEAGQAPWTGVTNLSWVFASTATVPGIPTGVTATAGNAQATVSWTAPVSDGGSPITNYVVTPFIGAVAQTPTTVGNVTSTPVIGLSNGTTYTFKVAAVNVIGTGSQSAASNPVTPSASATVPGAPVLITAIPGNGSVALSWSAPVLNGGSPVTGYKVYRGTSSGAETLLASPAGTGTAYSDATAVNGTTYFYKVSAVNAVGEGTLSNELSATPSVVVPGPNVNVSKTVGSESEGTIAVNPTNPLQVFAGFNGAGVPFRRSTDGGATWGPAGTGIGSSCCDEAAAFDSFGNPFLVNLNGALNAIVLYLSIDGGATFTALQTIDTGDIDQPSLDAGAGSVWVTWNDGVIKARGAAVTGLGAPNIGAFSAEQAAPGTFGQFGDIAIGPTGKVVVPYQSNTQIFANTDADGLGPGGFGTQVTVSSTNVDTFDFIPAQSGRSIDAEANLAWDRSGGATTDASISRTRTRWWTRATTPMSTSGTPTTAERPGARACWSTTTARRGASSAPASRSTRRRATSRSPGMTRAPTPSTTT
jgi:hypothetical protein